MQNNAFMPLVSYLRTLEHNPRVTATIGIMDKCIAYMTRKGYRAANAAMAEIRMPMVAGFWAMLIIGLVILIWGAIVPIESAVVAKGHVALLSSKKTIQHLEGGIINEILVKEGDHVQAGQELVRLSDTSAAASRDIVQQQLYAARASRSRLIAERDNLPEVAFDADMVEKAKTDEEVAKILTAQANLFKSELEMQKAKLAILDQRIAESNEEIGGLKSQIEGTSGQLNLYDEELGMIQEMYDKGYDTKPHLLEVQRHHNELKGNQGQYQSQVAKAGQGIAETKMSILDQQNEFQTRVGKDLHDEQAQIADLESKLHAAQDVVNRTKITAPVSGIVMGLKYHTSGGVISPGSPIMDIVPQNDQLIIEVHVKPTDIANVHEGQDAKTIFTAYKMRSTPRVPGKVTQVSADAFTDEHSAQPASYYTARVEVDKSFLQHMQKHIELYPGMPADVLIKTGSRSFIGYLFKPIGDSMHGAFREE